MNVDDVVSALRREARTVVWPGESLEAAPFVTRRISDTGGETTITAYALDESNVDAEIQAELARCREPFEWKAFSFDQSSDLVERLAAAGFEIGDREAVVVYDLMDGLTPFEPDSEIEVRRVTRPEEIVGFRDVAEAAFGKDYGFTSDQLVEALRTGKRGHDAYVASVEGTPASVGRLYTNPQSRFAGLYGGGTRPEFRRRGLYRAIVSARAYDALAAGARYLVVDALPTSLPILKRMGFAHVADTWPCRSPSQ